MTGACLFPSMFHHITLPSRPLKLEFVDLPRRMHSPYAMQSTFSSASIRTCNLPFRSSNSRFRLSPRPAAPRPPFAPCPSPSAPDAITRDPSNKKSTGSTSATCRPRSKLTCSRPWRTPISAPGGYVRGPCTTRPLAAACKRRARRGVGAVDSGATGAACGGGRVGTHTAARVRALGGTVEERRFEDL